MTKSAISLPLVTAEVVCPNNETSKGCSGCEVRLIYLEGIFTQTAVLILGDTAVDRRKSILSGRSKNNYYRVCTFVGKLTRQPAASHGSCTTVPLSSVCHEHRANRGRTRLLCPAR